ncbi:MAG: hypothetical protein GWP08_02730 [Nitrospiraceae bacterium]|nr:hypothetical protein [Nitrospiraceae bacterium]
MPLATCPRCKKMFEKIRSIVCPKCQDEENTDYDRIRGVLDAQPNLNAEQVSVEADVDVQCVMRMIDEGLISNVEMKDAVKCGRCGAPAISRSKKLCQACLEKLNAKVIKTQAQIKLQDKKDVQVGERVHARKMFEEKRR